MVDSAKIQLLLLLLVVLLVLVGNEKGDSEDLGTENIYYRVVRGGI